MPRLLLPLLLVCSLAAAEAPRLAVEHPFLLWTADEIAAQRARLATDPQARAAHEQLLAENDRRESDLRDLYLYAVADDRAAGERQKRALLDLLKAPDPWGGALEWRILAYDLLQAELAADQRAELERRFRAYIAYSIVPGGSTQPLFNDAKQYSRYDGEGGVYTRTNWLPNIIFPRKLSANLMALVLRDEALIRATWAEHGSIRWYLDDYLGDEGLYFEEFSKMGATPGALLLYCLGARHAGLDALGFGHAGARGATVRGHIRSCLALTFPALETGTDRPRFPRFVAGDIRGFPPFQAATVAGFFADGSGGTERWRAHGAWGGTTRGRSEQWDNDKTAKMQPRLWFELAHRLWPEDGYAFFLAAMRPPDAAVYVPSPYFGIPAIDPAQAPPPPAPSAVHRARGVAVLRHDESPDHWTGPAPALGVRLANEYAHHVNDAFALCGFQAFNRPLYANPHPDPGYAFGYSRSVRSHCAVMVDGDIAVDDWGKTGSREPRFTDAVEVRFRRAPAAKLLVLRSDRVYEDCDLRRALLLGADWLLDVSTVASPRPRSIAWSVHAIGSPLADERWRPDDGLAPLCPMYRDVRGLDPRGGDWSLDVVQSRPADLPSGGPLPDAWYERRVGVRVTMLGVDGLRAYHAPTPRPPAGKDGVTPVPPVACTSLVAALRAPTATLVALHQPFVGSLASRVARLEAPAGAVAIAVHGAEGDDLALIDLDGEERVIRVQDGAAVLEASGHALVRRRGARVELAGGIRALVLPADAPLAVVVDGHESTIAPVDGVVRWSR